MSAGEGFGPLAGILAMMGVTYLIRVSGFWMMAHVPLTPRVRRMLDALPGSVVVATIVPIVLRSGSAGMLGIAAVVGIMLLRFNEFVAVFAGLGLIALLRALGA
jgi:uncharacterized membrane protein